MDSGGVENESQYRPGRGRILKHIKYWTIL